MENSKLKLAGRCSFSGFLTFLVVIFITVLVGIAVKGMDLKETLDITFKKGPYFDVLTFLSSTIIAPFFENIFILLFFYVINSCKWIKYDYRQKLYISVCFLFGFVVHGMNVWTLSRGVAFSVFGYCLWHSERRFSLKIGYLNSVICHSTMNLCSLVAIYSYHNWWKFG